MLAAAGRTNTREALLAGSRLTIDFFTVFRVVFFTIFFGIGRLLSWLFTTTGIA